MENNPILTISILISDREDTVRKCLDSIQPLLQAVPSELILTDTGCGEKVRRIIEEYTEHIIDFTWIRDFSAARNAGLLEAKGKWFMYLDDDEWFEDVQDIIDFFVSGEEQNYSVACYFQRNYTNFKGTDYKDHSVDRILRRVDGLHFEHRVHEEYVGIDNSKKKQLNSYVHHYGYVISTEEQRIKKYMRNEELLQLECQEHPEDMRMWHQLILNQYSEEKWDEAIGYALQAISHKSDSEYWDLNHMALLFCLEQKKDWKSMKSYCEEFFKQEMFSYEIFGILQYAMTAYWNLQEYEAAAVAFEEAVGLYEEYKTNPEVFNKQQLMIKEVFDDEHVQKMFAYGINSLCHENNTGRIQKVFSYDNGSVIKSILDGEQYDNMRMLAEGLSVSNQLQEILQLPSFQWIMTMPYYEKKKYIHRFVWRVPQEDFELWEGVSLEILAPDSWEELQWFVEAFDRKISNISFYIRNAESESEKTEIVVNLLSCYADSMVCLCRNQYRDEVLEAREELLSEKEQVAFILQDLIEHVTQGLVGRAIEEIRMVINLVPSWNEAVAYIPNWIHMLVN